MGILAGAAPESSPRLVSVQPLPEEMAACTWEQSTGTDPNLIASLQQENLFSSLDQDSSATLMAALQQASTEGNGQMPGRGRERFSEFGMTPNVPRNGNWRKPHCAAEPFTGSHDRHRTRYSGSRLM
jgi:hypothetical protein